jgi:hypothetical protein
MTTMGDYRYQIDFVGLFEYERLILSKPKRDGAMNGES